MKTPKDFMGKPWGSIFQNSETEWVAQNIMKILKRNGDSWRELSWDEYCDVRIADTKDGARGGWNPGLERPLFDKVLPYTVSQEQAEKFAPNWGK